MDNYNQSPGLFSLEVDEVAKSTFLEMARWTKFLSIMGFIFSGLILVAGLVVGMAGATSEAFAGSSLALIGATGIMVFYVLIACIGIYPSLMLYRYATGIKNALMMNDKLHFNNALRSLKRVFKFYGIMIIVMLCIYGVAIIAVIAGVAMKGGR